MVPQLTMYERGEFFHLICLTSGTQPSPQHRTRRAVFLPVLVGISLAASVAAIGLSSGALAHSVIQTQRLSQQILTGFEDSAASLASLQRQITSLAQLYRTTAHWTFSQRTKGELASFFRKNAATILMSQAWWKPMSSHFTSSAMRCATTMLPRLTILAGGIQPCLTFSPTDRSPGDHLPLSAPGTLFLSIFPRPPPKVNVDNLL
jgi:hypothetical protein